MSIPKMRKEKLQRSFIGLGMDEEVFEKLSDEEMEICDRIYDFDSFLQYLSYLNKKYK